MADQLAGDCFKVRNSCNKFLMKKIPKNTKKIEISFKK